MKENLQILGIVFSLLFIGAIFGYNFHPDTKKVYVCPKGFGNYDTFSDKLECPYVVNEK